MIATAAEVRFGPDSMEVCACLRLSGRSNIMCCVYPEAAPILAVDDRQVRISVTVPEPSRVTDEDVQAGRKLAEAAATYAAELERLASQHAGQAA